MGYETLAEDLDQFASLATYYSALLPLLSYKHLPQTTQQPDVQKTNPDVQVPSQGKRWERLTVPAAGSNSSP